MQGINFLRLKQEKIRQKTQRVFFVQISVLSILVLYGLLVIGIFSYYFILNREAKVFEEKISFQNNRIKKEVATETKQIYLKKKTASLTSVLQSARNHQLLVEGVFSLLPEGISVSGFNVSEKGEVSFQGKAVNFSSLKALFENIKKGQLVEELPIYGASINSISLNEENGFNFGLTLYLSPFNKKE